MRIPRGVDLIIWKDGPELIHRSLWQVIPDGQGDKTSQYSYGDIVKVEPKGWHVYFDISPQTFILHVKNIKYNNHYKFFLTKECRDIEGKIIMRRRHAVDMDKLQKKIARMIKRKGDYIVVRSLDGLLIDKED